MHRPTVRFLGGVREIGGNKIVVEDGPERILFDFGPSFSPLFEEYYVDFLQPRSPSPVKDLLEFGLIPRLEGLYSEEALTNADLPYRPPEFQAIFLTHAHADHAGYLRYVDPTIPVYVGRGTRHLLQAIEESTFQKYGAHDFRVFTDRSPVKVGAMEVVPYPVDHSIPFAYGYLVRTSEGSIAYTGDFRKHGPRAENTHRFFEAVEAEKPAVLAIEGTRAGPDPRANLTEEGVRDHVDRVLHGTPDIALACTYPRDVDRLTTLYAAAEAAERTLVVSYRTAFLLQSLQELYAAGALPNPGSSPDLAVYGRRKRRYFDYEKPFLETALTGEELRAHGRRYLLALDFQHFPELIDLRPPKGTPYVHSMSEPFSEDDVNDRVMHNWLDHFGLKFHQAHASGHASATELFEIVRKVRPGTVYPIHTEHPEAFQRLGPRVKLPEVGTSYAIGRSG